MGAWGRTCRDGPACTTAFSAINCAKILVAAALSMLAAVPTNAQTREARWITLGTQGGPIALKSRSQPANVLLTADGAYVVDAGDGVEQSHEQCGESCGERV